MPKTIADVLREHPIPTIEQVGEVAIGCGRCGKSGSALDLQGTKDGLLCHDCVDWPRYRIEKVMRAKSSAEPTPTPQAGVSPAEANFNVELMLHITNLTTRHDRLDARLDELQKLTGHVYQCLGSDTNRINKLDARLASLENVYADVRRAQNDLEKKTPA